jgi:enamine deaminase RidA (YjgF/YER057c/UK114 family)
MLCATPPSAATGNHGQTVFGSASVRIVTAGLQSSLHITLPVLSGPPHECLLSEAEITTAREDFVLLSRKNLLAGFALAKPGLNLETAAADLYQRLFAVCRGQHLYRIWNYVPQINTVEHGLENYRHFCRGRSLAFERQFGLGFKQLLPAASAVGSAVGPLALSFLAGSVEPKHFENPRQVPAFDYPPQYGPRAPSFARATAISHQSVRQVFISGTAAIIGHESIATGDLDRQLDCTLENMSLIGANAGAGKSLGAGQGWTRSFKVYVRHATDLPRITTCLARDLLQPGDTVQYIQADICRADLLVEIEAVLRAQTG